jgi:hypothetical protein
MRNKKRSGEEIKKEKSKKGVLGNGRLVDLDGQINTGQMDAQVNPLFLGPSAATEDYWQKIGNKLIRLHVTPRRKLFFPSDLSLKHLLAPGEELTGNRVTVMTAVTDKTRKETLQHDLQTAHSNPQSTVGYWTGKTTFTVKLTTSATTVGPPPGLSLPGASPPTTTTEQIAPVLRRLHGKSPAEGLTSETQPPRGLKTERHEHAHTTLEAMLANPKKDSAGRLRDHWIELPDRWVRLHVLKRNTLFVPTGTSDGPSETDIQHLRHTALYNGNCVSETRKSHFDNWTSARLGSRKIDFTWTGATIFYKKEVTANFLHDLRIRLNSERLDTDDAYPPQQDTDMTGYDDEDPEDVTKETMTCPICFTNKRIIVFRCVVPKAKLRSPCCAVDEIKERTELITRHWGAFTISLAPCRNQ